MSKMTFARLEKLERAGPDREARIFVASNHAEADRLQKLHPRARIIITGVSR